MKRLSFFTTSRFFTRLTFLIVPSILFWVTFFLLAIWYNQYQREILEKQLIEAAHLFCVKFDDRPKKLLEEAFEKYTRTPGDQASLKKTHQEVMKIFAGRRVLNFLFDSTGACIPTPGNPPQPGIERIFHFLRQPWEVDIPPSSSLWQGMEGLLTRPDLVCRIRAQEGVLRVLGHQDNQEAERILGYYRWNPQTPGKQVAGMLSLVWIWDFSFEFMLRKLIERENQGIIKLGFHTGFGKALLPAGIASDTFLKIVDQHRFSGNDLFQHDDWLVHCIPFWDNTIFVAMIRAPGLPSLFLFLTLAGYVLISIQAVRFSRRLFPDQTPSEASAFTPEMPESRVALPTISLRAKLQILFLLGALFPLFSTGTLGLLYLQEKKSELILANRTEALKRLDQIDQDFEGVSQKRQLFYDNLQRRFSRGEETYETVLGTFERLRDESRLDDIFVVSSQSQLLMVSHSLQKNDYHWLITQPPATRKSLFKTLLTHERYKISSYDEARCVLGQLENAELSTRITHQHTAKLKKLLPKVGRECIDYSNENQGLRNLLGNNSSDLLIDEMVGNEGQTSFRHIKLSQGNLIPVPQTIGEGYLYVNVLRDGTGRGQYAIFLFHDFPSLQRDYLSLICSESPDPGSGAIIRAYSREDSFSLAYPVIANDPYGRLTSRFSLGRRDSLFLHLGDGPEEAYLVLRTAKLLPRIDLLHILPASAIRQQLRWYQYRVAGFMAGILLFCLTLGWILLQRFLRPVQQLAEGVKAISNRDFQHRVDIQSRDELGQLGQTLNRTIAYLGEMEMALTIQRTLFPSQPLRLGDLEIDGRNEMTQTIGGDYYDYFKLSEQQAVILLGDVSGHGVSAALVTAMAKAGFHILFDRFPKSPEKVFEQLNTQFYEILRRKKMMTCICGLVDTEQDTIRFFNAGQSFPVMVQRNGETTLCDLVSNPLGVLKKGKFAQETLPLNHAGFVLYSDGLIEANNAQGQVYSYEQFQTTASAALRQSTTNPADAIFQTVRQFTGDVPWNDDATVVIIRRV